MVYHMFMEVCMEDGVVLTSTSYFFCYKTSQKKQTGVSHLSEVGGHSPATP